MTSWRWQNGSGDFDDTDHWTDGSPDDKGFPGAGDDAVIDSDVTVTADGQTVKTLTLDDGATVTGGLSASTIQGIGLSGSLNGGVFTATTVQSVTFAGGTLNATTINAGTLAGGHVDAGTLSNFNISGAHVHADSIGGFGGWISDGSLDVDAFVLKKDMDLEIDGGTVTAATFSVVGNSRSAGMDMGGGTMTVAGAASLIGDWGDILVNEGATLELQGGFKLTASRNSFEGNLAAKGGEIVTDGRAVVDMAHSHQQGGGLLVDGGTMKFTGTLTLGQKQQGDLDVQDFGKVSAFNLVAGSAAHASGDIDVNGSALSSIGTVTLGVKGQGSLSLEQGSAANLKNLVLGAETGGSGSVSVSGQCNLHVTKTTSVGENGKGSINMLGGHLDGRELVLGSAEDKANGKGSLLVTGDADASFRDVSIWKNGSLSVSGLSSAVLDFVTIEKNGRLSVSDNGTGAFNFVTVSKTASMSVSGGLMRVSAALEGDGEVTIGKAGKFILNAEDKTVDISFAAGSKGAHLSLGKSNLMDATINGFTEDNSIFIGGLDKNAAIQVAVKGANTVVSITDHGKDVGSLTFAGHYARASMQLSASGVLTTTANEQSGAKADPSGGTSGTDHLHGRTASHMLDGGGVAETLSAAASHDSFVFDDKLGANADTILDFNPAVDHLQLDSTVFAALTPGKLFAEAFVENANGKAEADHAQIIYDRESGDLFYDADGSGGAHSVHFSTLAAHLHLSASDFIVM